jgi:hypothetical protein
MMDIVILVVAIAFLGNGKRSFTTPVFLVREICSLDELVGSGKEHVNKLGMKHATASGCTKTMSDIVKYIDKNTRLGMQMTKLMSSCWHSGMSPGMVAVQGFKAPRLQGLPGRAPRLLHRFELPRWSCQP